MNLYGLSAVLLLPFRAWLPSPALKASGRFFNDDWETEVILCQQPRFRVLTAPGWIDSSLCTIVEVSTFLPFEGDRPAAKVWARNNAAAIVADRVLPRLNEFLMHLKYAYPRAILTGSVRNVGDIDLVYSYLFVEGEGILCRSSPSESSTEGIPPPLFLLDGPGAVAPGGAVDHVELRTPSKEWVAITRAVDLVNHGYFAEAFVVSFALLDALVQDFVRERLPNLSSDEAGTVMARIESHRLKVFLGPLLRICLGASPLDDKAVEGELKWFNEKRNAIMHRGDACSREESQRGVAVAWRFLRYLDEKGANYSLPSKLEFWTPADAAKVNN